MISKNIHQIWVGEKKPPLKIMNSWKRYCEKYNWKYHLWTENEIETLNLKNKKIYKYYQNNTDNIPIEYNYRAMSDIARLEIINKFGGYYFDCDLYSWNNDIEKIIDFNHNMLILTPENLYPKDCTQENKKVWQPEFLGDFNSSHFVANGVFYANPCNNILSDLIDNLDEIHQKNLNIMWENYNMSIVNASWYTCGCWQLTHFSKKYPFLLLPQKYIFSNIEYAFEKGTIFTNNIISSCIHDHNENRLNNE